MFPLIAVININLGKVIILGAFHLNNVTGIMFNKIKISKIITG